MKMDLKDFVDTFLYKFLNRIYLFRIMDAGEKKIYLTQKENFSYLSDDPESISQYGKTSEFFDGLSINYVSSLLEDSIKGNISVFDMGESKKIIRFPSTNYFFIKDLMGILEKVCKDNNLIEN